MMERVRRTPVYAHVHDTHHGEPTKRPGPVPARSRSPPSAPLEPESSEAQCQAEEQPEHSLAAAGPGQPEWGAAAARIGARAGGGAAAERLEPP